MADVLEYKCPCCGGAIAFDSQTQKMKCPYCDTEFETETLRELDEELKNEPQDNLQWDKTPGTDWEDGETGNLRQYVCNSCGGEILTDETTSATSCPYCGNPVVLTDRVSGSLRPDCVIPFKLDKKAAKEGLKKHLCGKRLLPKVFKDENHLDEVKGVYVPVWLFDADADAQMHYRATRVRHWSSRDYLYTETSFYAISRSGSLGFSCVPVDGSRKMQDELMESLEPYDFRDAVDFQTAYLAGYLADKYDVSAEDSMERANQRIRKSTEEAFAETVKGYVTVVPQQGSVQLQNGSVRYALYPVWMLQTTWRNTPYLFAMNGQTGKFVGDLPMDKAAFFRWFFGLLGAVSAGVFALLWLIWLL